MAEPIKPIQSAPVLPSEPRVKKPSVPRPAGPVRMGGDQFVRQDPSQAADALESRIVGIIGKQPNPTVSFILRAGEELQSEPARLAWYEVVLRDHDLPATDTDPVAARVMIGRLASGFLEGRWETPRLSGGRANQFALRALEAIQDDTKGLARFAHDQAQVLRNPNESRALMQDTLAMLADLPDEATAVDAAQLAATIAVERIEGTRGDLSEKERAQLGLAALELVANTFGDPVLKRQLALAKAETNVEEQLALVHEALMGAL